MVKIIFDHIIERIGSDLGVMISYEEVEEKFNIDFQEFQTIARNYSYSFGLRSTATKDNISFMKLRM